MAVEHDDSVCNSSSLQSNSIQRGAYHYHHGHNGLVNNATHVNSPFTLGSAFVHSVNNNQPITTSNNSAGASSIPSAFFASNSSGFRCVSQPYSPPPSPTPCKRGSILANLPSPLASGPELTTEPNWQATKANIRERNAAMINNELMSDVTFLIGPSKKPIYAHKYVLCVGSGVFYAMFYGNLAESKKVIEIPDVEPVAFLALLK